MLCVALLLVVLAARSTDAAFAGVAQPRQDGMPRHVTDSKKLWSEKGPKSNTGPAAKIKEGIEKALGKDLKAHSQPLTKSELKRISSVRCLKNKQLNRNYPCGGDYDSDGAVPDSVWSGILDIGNYPSWKDPVCHSDGELFCDPHRLLDDAQSKRDVLATIQHFKQTTQVTCGALEKRLRNEPMDDTRYFNLGVVVANDWEGSESDTESLQRFGTVLMTRWGMNPVYNGVDTGDSVNEYFSWSEYYKNCPNAAMLIILPDRGTAFLSSPSCEFICKDRGGPEVVATVKKALEDHGLARAIEEGVDAVARALAHTSPKALERSYNHNRRSKSTLEDEMARSEDVWSAGVFALFVIVVGGLILVVVGVVTYAIYPSALERFGVIPPNELRLRKP